MCGYLGCIGKEIEENRFKSALRLISYRGPDYTGYHLENEISLGHNRLSIVDLDARSNQPFYSFDKSVILLFNGEIYNFEILRKDLQKHEVIFETQSDTEVILKGYLLWGKEIIKKLQGMFSLAIIDKKDKKLFLTRDRVGEKPLFYAKENKSIVFGSEVKSILPLLEVAPIQDKTSLLDYLTFGFIPDNKTLYSSIFKVRPGELLTFDISNGVKEINIEKYFNLNEQINPFNSDSINLQTERFDDIIKRVALQVSNCDVKFGAFLSGGVDSSLATWALKSSNSSLDTFTIGFDDKNFDESEYANVVSEFLEVKNRTSFVGFNNLQQVYNLAVKTFDEPFNDYSFVPTYYVCQEARKFGTVAISGDGADELFAGYWKYPKMVKLDSIHSQVGSFSKIFKGLSYLLREQNDLKRQLYRIGLFDEDLFSDLLAVIFKKRELKKYIGLELEKELNHYNPYHHIQTFLSEIPKDWSYLQKLRYLDLKMTLPDDMLVKVDRMSMLNSLEVRPLFLHPEIINFALQLPDEYLSTSKLSKVFLKNFAQGKMPYDLIYRKKMGFGVPFNKWVNHELKQDFLMAIEKIPQEIINTRKISTLLDLHSKNKRDFAYQLHSMLSLSFWL